MRVKEPTYEELKRMVEKLKGKVSKRKGAEKAPRGIEKQLRLKLDSPFSPDVDPGEQDLANIIDKQALQSLMDDFYALTKLAIWIHDLKGNILVGTGWQDICIKFHRINPQTLKNCIDSDLMLTGDVKPGEFRVYKCKNNIWDIVTPLFIGEKHVGNIYFGQFFTKMRSWTMSSLPPRRRSMASIKKTPCCPEARTEVEQGQGTEPDEILREVRCEISKLSYSNLKVAKLISDQKQAVESLKEQFLFLQHSSKPSPTRFFLKIHRESIGAATGLLRNVSPVKEEEIIGKSVYDLYPKELADILPGR